MLVRTLGMAVIFFGIATPSPGEENSPLWLLIGRADLREGATALIEHRRETGMMVVEAEPPITKAVASVPREPSYIILLGDDQLGSNDGANAAPEADSAWLRGERHTLYRWRATQPATYVSDAVFGDLDRDGIPEIPVGRLPGRTPESIAALAQKIVAFEKRAFSWESLHVPVWAGNPAYGDHFQANMASNLLRRTLYEEAPAWADLTLIMGNASDPLSADPITQGSLFHDILAPGGGLFTGLMGHGGPDAFYSMPHNGKWIRYHAADAGKIPGTAPKAPVIIFACDCGNFAHRDTSLGEALLLAPAGPVAVIAATTQSHPLPNYYSSVCWLQGVDGSTTRLGDLWVETQRRGYEMRNPLVEMFLKNIEGKLGAVFDTAQVRRDHLLLYALLGDPATPLKLPRPLAASFTRSEDAWTWKIDAPPPGAKRLVVSHRAPPPPLKPKSEILDREEALTRFHEVNASFRFAPLADHTPVETWSGSVPHRRGTIRLVVETDQALFVATQTVK